MRVVEYCRKVTNEEMVIILRELDIMDLAVNLLDLLL